MLYINISSFAKHVHFDIFYFVNYLINDKADANSNILYSMIATQHIFS